MNSRRNFFKLASLTGGAIAAGAVSRVALATLPEAVSRSTPATMPPLQPASGRPYNPVVTLNGWTLPWRMNVGQMRQIEFVADEEGDWSLHCHKSHHTMNAMSHDIPPLIGVDQASLAQKITRLVPDYMAIGEHGMGDMTEMKMPLPENTLPMMMGDGPFGSLEMGGMFSVLKVRKNQKPGDYSDPGWYKHPKGTVAYEYQGPALPAANAPDTPASAGKSVEVQARKPGGHGGH